MPSISPCLKASSIAPSRLLFNDKLLCCPSCSINVIIIGTIIAVSSMCDGHLASAALEPQFVVLAEEWMSRRFVLASAPVDLYCYNQLVSCITGFLLHAT